MDRTRLHRRVNILQDPEMINVCCSEPPGLYSSLRKFIQDPSPPLQGVPPSFFYTLLVSSTQPAVCLPLLFCVLCVSLFGYFLPISSRLLSDTSPLDALGYAGRHS